MPTNTQPAGFRADIMVLHALSDLLEKNPALPRPDVKFASNYGEPRDIRWFIHADYNLKPEGYYWDYEGMTYEDWQKKIHDLRREDLERRIGDLVAAIEAHADGPIEWVKNDPTKDSYYYRLSTTWHGAALEITTSRDSVCEKVVVSVSEREEEVPDPELHETFLKAVPKVKVMVKDEITEWQCNEKLAAATAPRHTRTTTPA